MFFPDEDCYRKTLDHFYIRPLPRIFQLDGLHPAVGRVQRRAGVWQVLNAAFEISDSTFTKTLLAAECFRPFVLKK